MSKKVITDTNKLKQEYESGLSANELAKQYHTSVGVITSTLRRDGVELRTQSDSAKIQLARYGHPSLGRKHSEATREKMRANHADFSGEKHPRYKGRGKYAEDGAYLSYDAKGYLRRVSKGHPLAYKDGLIGEHVYQACLKWGVKFVRDKDVHHINGVKDDNRTENLICITRSEHRKLDNNLKKH